MTKELLQERLAEKLIQGILTGRWPIGSLLPKELELVESEQVSRHTVRAALQKLESLGMIRRKPHVGTLVIGHGQPQSLNRQLSNYSDLDRLATTHPRDILDMREIVVSRELAEEIGYPPGETLICFSMLRRVNESTPPIAWTTEYVHRNMQKLVMESRKHPELLMIELIGRIYHKECCEVKQTIAATLLTGDAARLLETKASSPALRIFRRYLDERGRTLLTTVSYHPADRYAFNLNVKI